MSMNKLPSTLFIGDLSIFCTIQDIEKVFSTYGPIVDIRIKRDENTNKNLSYGFVKYVLVSSAEQALNNLNGYVLCGRPMRISWASFKPKQAGDIHDNEMDSGNNQITPTKSSVHVSFTTLLPDIVVTEELLRNMFTSFGDIVDVTIKKAIVINTASIKGFGFVHFRDDLAGMRSAVTAANALANFILNDVSYQCTISRELEQRIKAEGYVHDPDATAGPPQSMSLGGGSQGAFRPPQQPQQQHSHSQFQPYQQPQHQHQHQHHLTHHPPQQSHFAPHPPPYQQQQQQSHQQQYSEQRHQMHPGHHQQQQQQQHAHHAEYGQQRDFGPPRVVSPALSFGSSQQQGPGTGSRYPSHQHQHHLSGYSEPPNGFAPHSAQMQQHGYGHHHLEGAGDPRDYPAPHHHTSLSHHQQQHQFHQSLYPPYHSSSQPPPPPPLPPAGGAVQHAYPPPPQADFQRPSNHLQLNTSSAQLHSHQHHPHSLMLPAGYGLSLFTPGSNGGSTSSSTVSPLSSLDSAQGMLTSPVAAYHAVVHQQQQLQHQQQQYPRHAAPHVVSQSAPYVQQQQQQQKSSGAVPPAPLSTVEQLSQALQTGRDSKPPSVLYANLHYKGLQAVRKEEDEDRR